MQNPYEMLKALGISDIETSTNIAILVEIVRKHDEVGLWRRALNKGDHPLDLSYCTDRKERRPYNDSSQFKNQVDPIFEAAKVDSRLDDCFLNVIFNRPDSAYYKTNFKYACLRLESVSQGNWLIRDRRRAALKGNQLKSTYNHERYWLLLAIKNAGIEIPLNVKKLVCSYISPAYRGNTIFGSVATSYGSWVDCYTKHVLILKESGEFLFVKEVEDSQWTSYEYSLQEMIGNWVVDSDSIVHFEVRRFRSFVGEHVAEKKVIKPVSDWKPNQMEWTARLVSNAQYGGLKFAGSLLENLVEATLEEVQPRQASLIRFPKTLDDIKTK